MDKALSLPNDTLNPQVDSDADMSVATEVTIITFSDEDWQLLLDLLDNPPPVSESLQAAIPDWKQKYAEVTQDF